MRSMISSSERALARSDFRRFWPLLFGYAVLWLCALPLSLWSFQGAFSANTPANLAMAVVMGDEKALTAAPGIGKKIAQRIILELKDKLAKEQGSFDAGSGGPVRMPTQDNKAGEAAAALAVLGYGSQEISAALKGIDMEALPLEEIIRQSLKKMVK